MLHSFAYSCWVNWKSALHFCWKGKLFLFLYFELETCQHKLMQSYICSNRIPEAAFMARSYLPSKVADIVDIWRKDLNKVTAFLLFVVLSSDF